MLISFCVVGTKDLKPPQQASFKNSDAEIQNNNFSSGVPKSRHGYSAHGPKKA